jgi:hypothetical protein
LIFEATAAAATAAAAAAAAATTTTAAAAPAAADAPPPPSGSRQRHIGLDISIIDFVTYSKLVLKNSAHAKMHYFYCRFNLLLMLTVLCLAITMQCGILPNLRYKFVYSGQM